MTGVGDLIDHQGREREPRLRVLGPLRLDGPSGAIPLGGPKERLVLAVLVARLGRTVSVDAFIDALWGDEPPRSAARTIHAYVSRVRKALEGLGPGVALNTDGRGYRLEVADADIDSRRFESTFRQGHEALLAELPQAVGLLEEALSFWTGEPFAELTDAEACAGEARRLVELRLLAQEDLAEAQLLAGVTGLGAELEALVAAEPFRERRWRLLMVALYRDGRQREALDAFQRARKTLIDEVGVEPGPELRATEAAVLAHDPALLAKEVAEAIAPDLPLSLDTFGVPLVGRADAMDALRRSWSRAMTGAGGLVAIHGPIGSGKTHLAAAFAGEVHAAGGVALSGRCDHALRGPRALVRTILRSGGVTVGALDDDGDDGDLAEALVRFVAADDRRAPVLMVLDDLHLADAATLELVADLAAWSAAAAVLVLGLFTSESDRPGAGDHVRGATQIELGSLSRSEVAEICTLYDAESWSSTALDALMNATAGLPLRVHETAAAMARTNALGRVSHSAERARSTRRRMTNVQGELAEGIEELQRLADRRRSIAMAQTLQQSGTAAEACPYKALAAFHFDDARAFFGRERLVAELVSRVAGESMLAVVGPSGSGKSSLVRAGLLPALADGALPGSELWEVHLVQPALQPDWFDRADDIDRAGRRLVVIDQAEEMFTTLDNRGRRRMLDGLVAFADSPATNVVLTLRSDFLDHCASHPALAERLTGHDLLVGPMTDVELRRAIELPARRLGFDLEAGLTDIVLEEVRDSAAGLPLLSTALAETWERRNGRVLTLDGYRASGAVRGAVSRLAESAFASLPSTMQPTARRVLVRLADTGEFNDVRRRRNMNDLVGADETSRVVVDRFVEHRLLARDGNMVEVAHEALLRAWPRLRSWIDEDAAGRRVRLRIVEGTRSWAAAGRDEAELLGGTALQAAIEWCAANPGQLTSVEQQFVADSEAAADQQLRSAEERAVHERRSKRRLARLLMVAAVLLGLAVAGGVVALVQRGRADSAADDAQRAGERADAAARSRDAQRLGALAQVQEDVDLSFLLAAQAAATDSDPATQAFLLSALLRSPRAIGTYRSDGPRLLALSLDRSGTTIALNENEGGVTLVDAATLKRLRHHDAPNGLQALQWDPAGTRLATVGSVDDTDRGWDVEIHLLDHDLNVLTVLTGLADIPASLAFSDDGHWLATTTNSEGIEDGTLVALWDSRVSGPPVATIAVPDGFGTDYAGLWFQHDGSELVIPRNDGMAVLSVPSLETLTTMPDAVNATANRDRSLIAYSPASNGAVTVIRHVATGVDGPLLIGHSEKVTRRAFSPDGRLLATVSDDRTVKIWTVADGRLWADLRGHAGRVLGVQFSPDSKTLYTAGLDRAMIAWDVGGDQGIVHRLDQPRHGRAPSSKLRVSTPDGRFTVAVTEDNGLDVVDLSDGTASRRTFPGEHGFIYDAIVAADSTSVFTNGGDGSVRRVSLTTGKEEAVLLPPDDDSHRYLLAASADGEVVLMQVGDHGVERRDARTLEPLGPMVNFDGRIGWAAFDPTGTRIALTTWEANGVRILDAADLSVVLTAAEDGDSIVLTWSADASTVLLGGFDGTVRRFDADTLALLGPMINAHDGPVTSVSVDPSASRFVTASTDGTAIIWNLATGFRELVVNVGPPNNDATAKFLSDDVLRVTYTSGETYDVDLRPDAWLAQACRVAGRSLTDEERAEFFTDTSAPSACPDGA